jgi:hypothetical protein
MTIVTPMFFSSEPAVLYRTEIRRFSDVSRVTLLVGTIGDMPLTTIR